jgi:thioredoxin-like negative regulator of GroEL
MRHFWKGFHTTKSAAPVRFKKHVIVLYWSPDNHNSPTVLKGVKNLSVRHPSVSVKIVDLSKTPLDAKAHNILTAPTVVLLRDGREVDRVSGGESTALLEGLFRKAQT